MTTAAHDAGATCAVEEEQGTEPTHSARLLRIIGRHDASYLKKVDSAARALTSDDRALAQEALSRALYRSSYTLPIPGFSNTTQVVEYLGTLTLDPIPDELACEVADRSGSRSETNKHLRERSA